MPEDKKFYSVTEVSKLFNVTRQAVLYWIKQEQLKAIKIGPKAYAIPDKEVQKALARRRKQ